MPIWEPGLEALVKANAERGRLTFTTDLVEGVEDAEAVFIAVGTPARRGDGHADLTYVFEAVRELAKVHQARHGRRHQVDRPGRHRRQDRGNPARRKASTDVSVASNPEFLREGAAIADFKHPDRIVVGAEDEHAQEVLKEIYRPLFLNRAPILFTGRRTAELTKYAANAFLAVKISFINEIADLCEAVDADVQDVARGIGLDNRIGPKFLHAGPGYGGSCFPKDTLALLQTADEAGVEQRIVAHHGRGQRRPQGQRWSSASQRALGGDVSGKRIGVLGLAFKPNTDDMRDAPSIPLIKGLVERGASVARSIRSRREQAEPLLLGDRLRRRRLRRRRRRRRAGDRHRVGRVPRARPRRGSPRRMRGKVLVDLRNVYDRSDAEARRPDLLRNRTRAATGSLTRLIDPIWRRSVRSGLSGYIGFMLGAPRIVVIGLGYVGLPLAVALASQFDVIGFDIDEGRDRRASRAVTTGPARSTPDALTASALSLTAEASDCARRGHLHRHRARRRWTQANRPDLTRRPGGDADGCVG